MAVLCSMPVLAVPGERALGHCDLPRHSLKMPIYRWGDICVCLPLHTGVFQEAHELLLHVG